MKTGVITTKTIASEGMEKSVMGMSQKGMEMATYFLRDRIYTDKEQAFIREYVSNAADEHDKHEIKRPVEVRLQKNGSQWVWSVRDFALGLNEHDIRNVFAMYFESTKSGSNKLIGGFGVGGKAGFSYTDTFYVTSYHDGVKTSYVCTLGAGTRGVPVGECYKVSEEPTTEQGIEISLDVTKSWTSVGYKTANFVKAFSSKKVSIVYRDDNNVEYVPVVADNSKTIGDYVFNSYSDFPVPVPYGQFFVIRMGGVVYPYKYTQAKRRNPSNTIVVDVPVGHLTLPITRENIEDLPSNRQVFVEIDKCLDEIAGEECSNFVTPKFGDLISGAVQTDLRTYDGQWFSYDFSAVFPKTRKWKGYFHRAWDIKNLYNTGNAIPKKNGKTMVFVFPNIKNLNNWHLRLQDSLKKIDGANYAGYVWCNFSTCDSVLADLDSSIDISDCVFVDIKTLKLPKLVKDDAVQKVSYQVYDTYGSKRYYTPEELDELVTRKYFNGVEPDDDWYSKAKDMAGLWNRTIGLAKEHGTRCNFRTVNSKRMLDMMVERGWITPEMDEYQKRYIELRKIEQERLERTRFLDEASSVLFGLSCHERTKKIIGKTPAKISRLRNAVKTILAEDSTRGRILKTSQDGWKKHFTRNDLRKILALK